MSYRITGLDPTPFRPLYGLSEEALAAQGARRMIADAKPGFPDRVELRDAEPGESLLLLNYTHLPVDTPYRSAHAIFVREGAEEPYDRIDHIPEPLRVRMISLRAFDGGGDMIDADLVQGTEIEALIERLFSAHPQVVYLHAHYAKRGCFAARIDRV